CVAGCQQVEMWVMRKKVSLLRRERFQLEALGVPDADLAEVVQIAAHFELRDGALVELKMPAQHGGELADTDRMAERDRVLVGDCRSEGAEGAHILPLERVSHVVDGQPETADFDLRLDVPPRGEVA